MAPSCELLSESIKFLFFLSSLSLMAFPHVALVPGCGSLLCRFQHGGGVIPETRLDLYPSPWYPEWVHVSSLLSCPIRGLFPWNEKCKVFQYFTTSRYHVRDTWLGLWEIRRRGGGRGENSPEMLPLAGEFFTTSQSQHEEHVTVVLICLASFPAFSPPLGFTDLPAPRGTQDNMYGTFLLL